jgi:hypothetical protein
MPKLLARTLAARGRAELLLDLGIEPTSRLMASIDGSR